jgi:hypothetical protein
LVPPLEKEAAGIISSSESILKAFATKHFLNARAINDLIKDVLKNRVCLVAPYPFRVAPWDEFNVTRDVDNNLILLVLDMFGMLDHSSSSGAHYVPLVQWGKLGSTRSFPWYSSAPSNRSG